ncbi:MAG TPA: methylated-DNA--[protein]-cysteine S-methyltransferase [Opitutaceae bacterium]|nr:methylated-DNA--[protein]-cysteine S-methyltransferase [Opitutaceae bacterium]
MPHTLFPTSFGTCALAWNGNVLLGFQLPDDDVELTERHLAARAKSKPAAEPRPDWVRRLVERVQQHLDGRLQDFSDIPLDWPRVSEFQRAVYLQAQAIKPGFKRSYGEIARALALGPEAARAVGVALASNPWPLVVPCHRVVSASNKMTGFSAPGGVRTKTRLLALEGAELLSE